MTEGRPSGAMAVLRVSQEWGGREWMAQSPVADWRRIVEVATRLDGILLREAGMVLPGRRWEVVSLGFEEYRASWA